MNELWCAVTVVSGQAVRQLVAGTRAYAMDWAAADAELRGGVLVCFYPA
jgi:hypothetical protein